MISWVTNQKNCTNIVTIEKKGTWDDVHKKKKKKGILREGGMGMRQSGVGGETEKFKTQRTKICNAN